MKKVLFFHTAHPRLNLGGQIQLEVLSEHVESLDKVFIVSANAQLVASQTNYLDPKYSFYHYKNLFDKTINILRRLGNPTVLKYDNIALPQVQITDFKSIQELKSFTYKQVNIGMGVASTLISFFRDHEFRVSDYQEDVKRELANAILVVDNLERFCSEIQPDLVYVFNGRMSTYAPVVQYCKLKKIEYRVFEFTSRYDKYHVLNNAIPHDIVSRENEMRESWSNNPDHEVKKKISGEFFEAQRSGTHLMDGTFAGAHQKKYHFDQYSKKEIITFFNSSIDEFASVPGWENYVYLYDSEVDAIMDICHYFKDDCTKQFVLRIHPNLKYLDNAQTRNLAQLKSLKNLDIIESISPISSYDLMSVSSKIITFGSTLGVEACYFGKPAILLGMSLYDNLDVSYKPDTRDELMELISTSALAAKPVDNVHIYGYWWMTFGKKFRFRDRNIYKSSDLDPTRIEILIGLFLKITGIRFWKRTLKIFDKDMYQKIKNPTYRLAIIRELMPWIKK